MAPSASSCFPDLQLCTDRLGIGIGVGPNRFSVALGRTPDLRRLLLGASLQIAPRRSCRLRLGVGRTLELLHLLFGSSDEVADGGSGGVGLSLGSTPDLLGLVVGGADDLVGLVFEGDLLVGLMLELGGFGLGRLQ